MNNLNKHKLETLVIDNFKNTTLKFLFIPFFVLSVIAVTLLQKGAFSVEGYIEIQKDLFFSLNSRLSEFPSLQFNLTQLGNPLVILPLLTVFFVYAPKFWGALFSTTIISAIISFLLKELFDVPRPAEIFNNEFFVIIGRVHNGFSSLPSGHSITIFTVITLLLFAFMPKEFKFKILWTVFILMIGIFIAFSRVGVGAHFPLDVVIGGAIGYICALTGIILNNKVSWWDWIKNKKYYAIIIFFLIIWGFGLIKEIYDKNLLVFYLSLFFIFTSLYLMIKIHVQK
jgi:membrane-associated phospholipid phosphatase